MPTRVGIIFVLASCFLIGLVSRAGETGKKCECFDFVDRFEFFDLDRPPEEPRLLLETEDEKWMYAPFPRDHQDATTREWTTVGGDVGQGREVYRKDGPIVVFDKASGVWRYLGISRFARAVYPVEVDPYDEGLIWIGCNDGPRRLHADGPGIEPLWVFDTPLQLRKSGGLAVIDTKRKVVRYFGPPLQLISSRVYKILFEKNWVWIYGFYPLAAEPGGISRYN